MIPLHGFFFPTNVRPLTRYPHCLTCALPPCQSGQHPLKGGGGRRGEQFTDSFFRKSLHVRDLGRELDRWLILVVPHKGKRKHLPYLDGPVSNVATKESTTRLGVVALRAYRIVVGDEHGQTINLREVSI